MTKPGKALEDGLSILLDEIQLAITWKRPSILFAVTKSTLRQEKLEDVLQKKLSNFRQKVVKLKPGDSANFLRDIFQISDSQNIIFYVQGLGKQKEIYHGLNIYRETFVEKQIKIVFWLTEDEIYNLPRLAPDFWAFRHRVVEFSSGRGSQKKILPAGLLLWRLGEHHLQPASIDEKIIFQKHILESLPDSNESLISRYETLYRLINLYWLKGDYGKAEELLRQGLQNIRGHDMNDVKASFLNGLAIICYDREKYKDALTYMEKALDLEPKNDILWANHGITNFMCGRSARAIQSVEKAIRIRPAMPDLLSVLGYLYLTLGRLDDALRTFDNALKHNPGSFNIYCALAVCWSRVGDAGKFNKFMQLVASDGSVDGTYRLICRMGLLGSHTDALDQLRASIGNGRTSPLFVRRDPLLNIIFSPELLAVVI
jgi:tetratricopeptide (TPR) repeat protein